MKATIAIISYKANELLRGCLRSLKKSPGVQTYEIIVVDNAADEDVQRILNEEVPWAVLISNAENIGFARAVNQAFRRSTSEYVLVLNPDIHVRPGSVEALLDTIRNDAHIGLCAPKLLNPDGSLQYSCRAFYTPKAILLRRAPLGPWLENRQTWRHHLMMDWDHESVRTVDWVIGAAMMLRRAAFPDGAVMDERFFLYFEDVDLCWRLKKAGWKVVYCANAVMVHQHQRASARGWWNRAKWEHLKSFLKFAWKYRREPILS